MNIRGGVRMNVREEVLAALSGSGEGFISGAALAERLGVSRNAVWKAVKALEEDGYIIDSVTAKGYRISPESNRLSGSIISAELETEALGKNITVLDETDSTNNRAKELAAAGALHGTVIAAEAQSAGKGRLGRSFVSPSGTGLYMSAIIRPDFSIETAPLITSCAACAAAEAVEELCGCPVNIKWVNDLYMNGRKICGILTEASLSLENNSLDYAVIGIGINVHSVKGIFDSGLSAIATSIEDETGVRISRNRLCAAILSRLERQLTAIESRAFLSDYRRRELLTGNMITANVGGEAFTGRAAAIDDNANLVVELSDGTRKTLGSGEANLCRIKD